MIKVPENIDVNVLQIINQGLNSRIDDSPNIIGSSEIPFCLRKTVLKKIYDVRIQTNAKMLFGKIFEEVLYKPEILKTLRDTINKKLGITKKTAIIPQLQEMKEIISGYFFRITPDIACFPYYFIEVKTTFIYVKYWTRELVSYQIAQLNSALGNWKIPLGFILKLNGQVFNTNRKQDEGSWDRLWLDYGYLIPIQYNHKLYVDTLERVKIAFECIENKKIPQVDCEFDWECKYCPVLKECGKSEIKCCNRNKMGKLCSKKMYEWEESLTDKFLENPICLQHYSELYPRTLNIEQKYNEFKFIKKWPWSD